MTALPREETPTALADDGVTKEPEEKVEAIKSVCATYPKIISRSVETQTDKELTPVKDNKQDLVNLKSELLRTQETLKEKENMLDQLRNKIK
nr:unnamed protein product [Callosobruchus analis]